MQHRIILSKTLLIAIKNRKPVRKQPLQPVPVITPGLRTAVTAKRYVRYATLAGLTRMRVEEIY